MHTATELNTLEIDDNAKFDIMKALSGQNSAKTKREEGIKADMLIPTSSSKTVSLIITCTPHLIQALQDLDGLLGNLASSVPCPKIEEGGLEVSYHPIRSFFKRLWLWIACTAL